MALLLIKIPRPLRGNRYLEILFYRRYPQLKKIQIEKFLKVEQISSMLNIPQYRVKNYLINSRAVFALETEGEIKVHPVGAFGIAKIKYKSVARTLRI